MEQMNWELDGKYVWARLQQDLFLDWEVMLVHQNGKRNREVRTVVPVPSHAAGIEYIQELYQRVRESEDTQSLSSH